MADRRQSTILHVAQRAGVSISTVSRVLNDTSYPVRQETRERVLEAIEALRFHPNPLARGLLGKPTQTIGLIVPDISNPYYPLLSRGVEDVASEQDYTVIFCNTDRSPAKTSHYLEVLQDKQVDGIIFAGGGMDQMDGEWLPAQFTGRVVLIGRHGWDCPSVQVDNVQAGREATGHLIALGHRRVAFIGGPSRLSSVRDRLKGYWLALGDAGIEPDEGLVWEGDFRSASGYQGTQTFLAMADRPTAIFAANDRMAVGAMAAVCDAGMRVPQDVAVVGCDDTPMASFVRPALTTISLPTYQIGASAARMLLGLLAGEAIDERICLPAQLVVRQSSGSNLGQQ